MTSIAEKISKLIAHEQSARQIGNIAEAEAFAAKIAQMMLDHNLSMSDVEIKHQEQNEPIEKEYVQGKRESAPWKGMIAVAVASVTFCRALRVQGTSTQIFVGRLSDRKAAIMFYNHLIRQADDLLKRAKLDLRDNNPHINAYDRAIFARKWGQSWLFGFAEAIGNRIAQQKQQQLAGSQGAALILRKDAALDKWRAEQTNIKKGRASVVRVYAPDARQAGYRAGQNVSLSNRAALNG